jgi:hypothetical protein
MRAERLELPRAFTHRLLRHPQAMRTLRIQTNWGGAGPLWPLGTAPLLPGTLPRHPRHDAARRTPSGAHGAPRSRRHPRAGPAAVYWWIRGDSAPISASSWRLEKRRCRPILTEGKIPRAPYSRTVLGESLKRAATSLAVKMSSAVADDPSLRPLCIVRMTANLDRRHRSWSLSGSYCPPRPALAPASAPLAHMSTFRVVVSKTATRGSTPRSPARHGQPFWLIRANFG